jgi:hypothetical protein
VAVAVGPPAEALLETARANDADLIMMTTHGRSGLERWAFGSVTDAVVRRGELPVMVVPLAAAAGEEPAQAVPVAGCTVVPPPHVTEREAPAATSPHTPATRPHRPERSPGR